MPETVDLKNQGIIFESFIYHTYIHKHTFIYILKHNIIIDNIQQFLYPLYRHRCKVKIKQLEGMSNKKGKGVPFTSGLSIE